MKTIFNILNLGDKKLGKIIQIGGWVKYNRANNQIAFIVLNDGSCLENLQIVCKKTVLDNFAKIAKINPHSAIDIVGVLQKSLKSEQKYEVIAKKVVILNEASNDYPLQKKNHTLEFMREHSHLRTHSTYFQAINFIRQSCIQSVNQFFQNRQFHLLHAPIITENDCEGGGEAFLVNDQLTDKKWFFGKESRLTVSGQLHAEVFAQSFKHVYTFGPTFRAEKSNTRFHASEFWMVEPEIAFGSLTDGIELAIDLMKAIAKTVLTTQKTALQYLAKKGEIDLIARIQNLIAVDFVKISYREAIQKLATNFNNKIKFGDELTKPYEKYLCENIFKKPVVVYDYPIEQKAFYMKINQDQATVAGFDILFPHIGEVVGGGVREIEYEKINRRVEQLQLDKQNLAWYLNLRKYGYAPSVGFGFGFDRFLMYLTGVENIRDLISFYRGFKTLKY